MLRVLLVTHQMCVCVKQQKTSSYSSVTLLPVSFLCFEKKEC